MNEEWSEAAIHDRVKRRVWRTTSGEEFPYERLSDEHLLRILAHLRRAAMIERGRSVAALCMYRPGGDAAADCCDSALEGFLRETEGSRNEEGGDRTADENAEEAWRRYARPELEPLEALARERCLDLTFLRNGSANGLVVREISALSLATRQRDLARARAIIADHENGCPDLIQARELIARHERSCGS